jgi:2-polyprenyl-3-methyl-5-hydroxy-6-metoxy-1,4-benzoquinol methylase
MQTVSRTDLLEPASCSVCDGREYDVVHEARYDLETDHDLVQKFRASGDELLIDQLVKCKDCGLQYISPRLRSDLILSSYSEGEDRAYVSQMAARERTFADALTHIEKIAGHRGRLLDVGTAAGAFLAAAHARGWQAEGCEPNRWLANWGTRHYGVHIRPGSVFEQSYEPGSFDVVTLWDVIEHTTNPREVLAHCRSLLRPGGVLVVNYPDVGSWIARALGRRWLFLTSVHLHYFDRKTMTRLLESTGFAVATIKPHVQRLELDYVLARGSQVSRGLSKVARALVRPLGLATKQVPYWLGQTFVAARRLGMILLPANIALGQLTEVLVLL